MQTLSRISASDVTLVRGPEGSIIRQTTTHEMSDYMPKLGDVVPLYNNVYLRSFCCGVWLCARLANVAAVSRQRRRRRTRSWSAWSSGLSAFTVVSALRALIASTYGFGISLCASSRLWFEFGRWFSTGIASNYSLLYHTH